LVFLTPKDCKKPYSQDDSSCDIFPGMENIEFKNQEQIYLFPCMGSKKLGIERGHVYKVCVGEWEVRGGQRIGFLPLEEALARFPDARVEKTDAFCPSCLEDLRSGIKQRLETIKF
jgi:hypothetical protein